MSKDMEYWASPEYECDDDGRVISIHLEVSYGVLHLDHIPPLVKSFVIPVSSDAKRDNLSGKLCVRKLPRGLEILQIANNAFFGVVELTHLPPNMISFIVAVNFLRGTCDLTALPKKLERCLLHKNNFTGKINLNELPSSLTELSLHSNKLLGDVLIQKLPNNLKILSVGGNHFYGSFAITQPNFRKNEKEALNIWANGNHFTGDVVVHRKARVKLHINSECFDSVVDERGRKNTKFEVMNTVQGEAPEFEWME